MDADVNCKVIFIMPTALPVTPNTMNYAVVYFCGILAFSAIYWFTHGRKSYTGPLVEAVIDEQSSATGIGRNDEAKEGAGAMP